MEPAELLRREPPATLLTFEVGCLLRVAPAEAV